MKNIFVISGFLLLCTPCWGQEAYTPLFHSGAVELNFLLDAGKMTTTYESGYLLGSHSNSSTYLNFSVLPGFFVAEGFSIEPEVSFLAVEKSKPAYSIIPNISYTYLFPESRTAVFARAGYGLSNSYSMFGLLVRQSNKMDVGIFNVGAGIKYLVSDGATLRIELNYKSSNHEEENSYWGYSSSASSTLESTRILVGFSLLL